MAKLDDCTAQFQNNGYEILESAYYSPRARTKENTFKLGFSFSYEVGAIDKLEDGTFRGIIKFDVKCYPEEQGESAVIVSTSIFGIFSGVGEQPTEESFKAMLELNGLTFLSQIVRTHILTLTSTTGNNPIVMPMININELIASQNK